MRAIAALCGLCVTLMVASASGAPRSSSSSIDSALNQVSATSLSGGPRQNPYVARASSEQRYAVRGNEKRTHGSHVNQVILLGNQATESRVGHNLVGRAEAFAFRAHRSGTAASITVYLGARDRATTLFAGLYSSRHGHPQSLLTSGLRRSPKSGAWNSVAVRSASLRSGTTYWLAVLGKGGAIYFRDRNGGSCGHRSSRRELRLLPRNWPAGPNSRACLISAYVKGAVTRASGGGTKVLGTTFCNIAAAYTDLDTGPHLCGWPDSTNTGYVHAPGYPGSLTTASSSSSTCPMTPQSNHTYRFCSYPGLGLPSGLTNVTFYGSEFHSNAVNDANVRAGSGDNNITFDYDTFQPNVSSTPVACSQSYQYGIYNEGGAMGGYTVEHSDFWGFGNAIDTEGSTQANPQIFRYNWIHDSSTTGGCGYHNDGIGMLNGGSEQYAVVDHNTIEFTGNTNLIAWQNGTYSHDQNTNNLLSGDNEGYAGGRCTSSCTAPTYIQTTGNTFNTYLAIEGDYPIDNATHYWANTGSTWNHNYWAVPPGAAWGTSAYNGDYWVPTTTSNAPQDCGFVSPTDYPNDTNPCRG